MAPPTNALALAGLILGIVAAAIAALVSSLLLALILSFVPAVLAIIFGFIGITTANRLGGWRRKYAIWAVVLGFTPALVWALARFVLGAFFGIDY